MEIKAFLTSQQSKRSAELDAIKQSLAAINEEIEKLEKTSNESEDETELTKAGEKLDEARATLDELNAKKAELEAELAEINAQIAELDKPKEGEENNQRGGINFMKKEERGVDKMTIEERTKRAEEFAKRGKMTITGEETRAMLVSSGKIATPTGVNDKINELNKTVSSIIDMVDVQDCSGMGANIIAYEYTAPEGGVTVEGETYAEGDTVTDFVTTTPKKVTTISYISEEARKLTPLAYEALVKKNAMRALRKKVSANIIEKIKASELTNKRTDITAIDAHALRKIALGYGGDEDVEGNAIIGLNKTALTAFGDVRGSNEKKAVYEITPDASNPNTGIIKDGGLSVQYVINSKLANNELIYGQGMKFELDLFGDYEVKVSEDFKFDKGLLAVRGSVMADGDVTYKDGFTLVTVGTGA